MKPSEKYVCCGIIDPTAGFAYFGTDSAPIAAPTSPAVIIKVRLSDFSWNNTLTFNPGESGVGTAVIDSVGGFAYFGIHQAIVKVRLSDFSRVSVLNLAPGEDPESSVIDFASGYAYFGSGGGPGDIVKVRLSDFTIVKVLNLTLATTLSSVIDTGSGFAYFGGSPTSGSGPGVIVKVRLSDLTAVGAITLNGGEGWPSSSVIDPVAGFAYFGVSNFCTVGAVVKVRLSDFTRVAYLPLGPDECNLYNAVLDPVRGFVYFSGGGCTIPPPWDPRPICASPNVVKVKLSDFTRVGSLDLGGTGRQVQ